MKNIVTATIVASLSIAATGCSSLNNALAEKSKTVEYYRIFDIKTGLDRLDIAQLASDGLGQHINSAEEATPLIMDYKVPKEPGRFKLVNPLDLVDSKFAALASSAGKIGPKMATCEGAVWTAKAIRYVEGSDKLNLTACLFPYTQGYHLDMYATFTKKSGGFEEITRQISNKLVGTPEEWTEKTFLDTVKYIHQNSESEIAYLEGYPKLQGTPWMDSGETFTAN